MQLTIITPSKKDIFNVVWLECNTPQGNYVIQAGHAPTIFSLSSHKPFIYCLKNGHEEIIMIQQAIIEVTRTHATLLLNNLE